MHRKLSERLLSLFTVTATAQDRSYERDRLTRQQRGGMTAHVVTRYAFQSALLMPQVAARLYSERNAEEFLRFANFSFYAI